MTSAAGKTGWSYFPGPTEWDFQDHGPQKVRKRNFPFGPDPKSKIIRAAVPTAGGADAGCRRG
jgi:hypothetical protein